MQTIFARLREPSSWAGIGGLLALFGLNVPQPTLQALSALGAAAAGVAAVLVPEKKG